MMRALVTKLLRRVSEIPRRVFLMAGALLASLLLGVGLTLMVVNTHDVRYVTSPQPTPTSRPAPTITQPPAHKARPASSAPAAAPQPAVVHLGMKDFTSACRQQYGDAAATAKIARNPNEPPSYWVKCFHGGQMLGGISLDDYCSGIEAGTRSGNRRRFDYAAAHKPWLSWQCVQA